MPSCKYLSILCAALALTFGAGLSTADIIVGGTATTNIITALNDLGEPFADVSPNFPAPGSADIIIIGMDGGNAGPDYNAYLDSGGDVIVTGGSSLQDYVNWVGNYFNTTDTIGWHTDGDYHELVSHPANVGMPDD